MIEITQLLTEFLKSNNIEHVAGMYHSVGHRYLIYLLYPETTKSKPTKSKPTKSKPTKSKTDYYATVYYAAKSKPTNYYATISHKKNDHIIELFQVGHVLIPEAQYDISDPTTLDQLLKDIKNLSLSLT